MKNSKTVGIILSRTDYGEADRIITFLTPDHGKLRALAKGVRKPGSKLAGGIELFCISQLSFVSGRSELQTLTGSRLSKHFDQIVKDLDRTQAAYELIRLLDKSTEDITDPGYFILAENALAAFNDPEIPLAVTELWLRCRLIRLSGHSPNLQHDAGGGSFDSSTKYVFDFSRMAFAPQPGQGTFTADQIKYFRLNFGSNLPHSLKRIVGAEDLAKAGLPLANSILQTFIRL